MTYQEMALESGGVALQRRGISLARAIRSTPVPEDLSS